ncbi:MAG TPA: polysaccharide deacetylase family protein [Firmicutes bacterium]|nr:polysaccharide deacetylase family protein [Bacillota bacterium]
MGHRKGRGRPRIWIVTLNRDSIFLNVLVFFVMVFTAYAFMSMDDVRRAIYGARPGVSLEGRDMSGLLEPEVERIVSEIAESKRRSPKDAMMHGESGEVIPEEEGIEVDEGATVAAVMRAAPGSKVDLVVHHVLPAITSSHFEALRKADIMEKAAAFGINVAWGEEYIDGLLDILRQENVKATFFFDGRWVELFPGLTRKIADEGHEVANHGFRHVHVKDLSIDEIKDLILKNEELLLQVAGKMSRLFAPPYGELDRDVLAAAGSLGYRTVLWTIDTIDWKSPTKERLIGRVTGKLLPGSIILMHPTAVTVAALPDLIAAIRASGYSIVTISDLIRLEKERRAS